MATLEYFAAHAPWPPHEWFVAEYERIKPPKPPKTVMCDACRGDFGNCQTPEICKRWRDYQSETALINDLNEDAAARAASAQWPWAYAKAVLNFYSEQKNSKKEKG